MPDTDAYGLVAPEDTDAFGPAAAMRAGRAPFASRIIVPVANQTARDALAASHSPTTSKPLYVYRADLDEIEYTKDGSTWRVPGTGPTVLVQRADPLPVLPTFPSATYTIPFDTEVDNPDDMWAPAQATRLTIPRTGQYLVIASYVLANSGGQYVLDLMINGVATRQGRVTGGDSLGPTLLTPRRLTAGDYLEFRALQTSGSNRSFDVSAPNRPQASVTWMHP